MDKPADEPANEITAEEADADLDSLLESVAESADEAQRCARCGSRTQELDADLREYCRSCAPIAGDEYLRTLFGEEA